jgi:putative inorganic carbon (hco3(-)) transporter
MPGRSLQSPRVTTFAAVTGTLPKLGVVVVAVLAGAGMLLGPPRGRALAMLGALVLAPVLLLADIWHSPQLRIVHRHPLLAAAGAVAALCVVAVVALVIARRPGLLAPLVVVALPFRIPIQAGGATSNLLVPLYLVVAAGALAVIVRALRGPAEEEQPATWSGVQAWLPRLLALYVVLYGIQSVYSPDFEKALQQMVFFYVPFALLFGLLARLPWSTRLVHTCLYVLIALALLFAAVGFVEYATKTIFLNPKLVAANDVHAYFTVNSVFFDPDIFGRFLAVVMIIVAVPLLYGQDPREQLGATAILAVLWGALVLTLSRSSLGALLVGLAALAVLRWRATRVVAVALAVVAIGAAAVAVTPKTFGLNQGVNGASSGRASLITGGLNLFGERPVWGYGSGSFSTEYSRHHPGTTKTLSASHAIPITIAAEQGVIGELAYLALVVLGAVVLLRGARCDPVRIAIAAAFLALVFHTLLYADFLEDPTTWTLLGVGTALAFRPRTEAVAPRTVSGEAAPVPA